jgi:hypothetical protein
MANGRSTFFVAGIIGVSPIIISMVSPPAMQPPLRLSGAWMRRSKSNIHRV